MGGIAQTIAPIALSVITKSSEKKEQASIQKQEIAVAQANDEEKRQKALRASVATQRARFGASGVDAGDGSAEAVLLGLFQQSEEEAQARVERDAVRTRAVENGSQSFNRNLLTTTADAIGRGFSNIFFS